MAMTAKKEDLNHLERVRNLCRAALTLGLVASLAANIVAADSSTVGRVVAGWPPLVLLIVVELIGRVSLERGLLSWIRLGTAGCIAGVAALVSYKHMLEVAKRAGEGTIEAHLIPLTVDGLVIVASVSLVGLNQRIRAVAPRFKPPTPSAPTNRPTPRSSAKTAEAARRDKPTVPGLPVGEQRDPASTARSGMAAAKALLADQPGMTHKAIADQLGVSTKTVSRAAAALKSEDKSTTNQNGVTA